MALTGSWQDWIFVISYLSLLLVITGCVLFFSTRR